MKKIIQYSFITLFSMATAFAQDFQGMAVYESKTSMQDMKMGMKDMTPEMEEMVKETIKPMFEKTFVLKFDKTASTYEEEERLDGHGQDPGPLKMMLSFAAPGNQYKNIKEKKFLNEKEMFGKQFLVEDSLITIKWKLETETKKIGNYTCYRATAVIPADVTNLMNFRPKKGVDEETVQKSTNFTEVIEMPKDMAITAWYTPEIPVSQGPGSYWGLPGLILEVSDDRTTMLCSKVVLNPKEKSEIKPYTKGTRVTRAQYAEICRKKMLQLQEMWQRGGN